MHLNVPAAFRWGCVVMLLAGPVAVPAWADEAVVLEPVLKDTPPPVQLDPVLKGEAPPDGALEKVRVQPVETTPTPSTPPEPTPKPKAPDIPGVEPADEDAPSTVSAIEYTPEERLALSLMKRPMDESVRERLRQFVVQHRESPIVSRVLRHIGRISLELDDPREAELAFSASLRVAARPEDRGASLAWLAYLGETKGDLPTAVVRWEEFEAFRASTPLSPSLRGSYARILCLRGEYESATEQYAKLVSELRIVLTKGGTQSAERRLMSQALFGLGLVNELLGHEDAALEAFEELVDAYDGTDHARLAMNRIDDLNNPLLDTHRSPNQGG